MFRSLGRLHRSLYGLQNTVGAAESQAGQRVATGAVRRARAVAAAGGCPSSRTWLQSHAQHAGFSTTSLRCLAPFDGSREGKPSRGSGDAGNRRDGGEGGQGVRASVVVDDEDGWGALESALTHNVPDDDNVTSPRRTTRDPTQDAMASASSGSSSSGRAWADQASRGERSRQTRPPAPLDDGDDLLAGISRNQRYGQARKAFDVFIALLEQLKEAAHSGTREGELRAEEVVEKMHARRFRDVDQRVYALLLKAKLPRMGDAAVDEILQRMAALGLKADAGLYNVWLHDVSQRSLARQHRATGSAARTGVAPASASDSHKESYEAERRIISLMAARGVVPDVVTFRTLLTARATRGDLKAAWEVMGQMQAAGIPPTDEAAAVLMRTMTASQCTETIARLESMGVPVGSMSFVRLMQRHVSSGDEQRAKEVFHMMDRNGMLTSYQPFNLLLRLCVLKGDADEAARIVQDMRARGVRRSEVTYDELLRLHTARDDESAARRMLREARADGVPLSSFMYNHLIEMHARSGQAARALAVLMEVKEAGLKPTSKAYRLLVEAHVRAGDAEGVTAVLNEVVTSTGLGRDDGIFNTALLGLLSLGQREVSEKVLDHMRSKRVPVKPEVMQAVKKAGLQTPPLGQQQQQQQQHRRQPRRDYAPQSPVPYARTSDRHESAHGNTRHLPEGAHRSHGAPSSSRSATRSQVSNAPPHENQQRTRHTDSVPKSEDWGWDAPTEPSAARDQRAPSSASTPGSNTSPGRR